MLSNAEYVAERSSVLRQLAKLSVNHGIALLLKVFVFISSFLSCNDALLGSRVFRHVPIVVPCFQVAFRERKIKF
jgi:hypothetical protein